MQLSTFDKANCSQQNLPRGKQTLSRLVNITHELKPYKFLTEISVLEASHCSLIDFTMHWTDGSKNEAMSELMKDIVILGPDIMILCWCLPKKFQLARANVEFRIFITNGAKLDILRLICVLEPELSSLIETFYYVGYIPWETGLPQ